MKLSLNIVLIGLFFSFSLLSHAKVPQWNIIPNESQLTFIATQNASAISADFKNLQGIIFADANQPEKSSIKITIDVNSLDASYSEVKKLLMGSDWLDAEKYPVMQYTCKKFEKLPDNSWKAEGLMTIRDKTHPLVLTFTAKEISPEKMLVVGNTSLNRLDFGVGQGEWQDTSTIKDEVKITFQVSATKL